VRGAAPSRFALPLLAALSALLGSTPVRAHGTTPETRQILLRDDRPEQIILATNFGLIASEDGGETWLFSCERGLSDYAGPFLLGAPPSSRMFAMTSGLIYSDDDSCTWNAAGGVLPELLLYAFAVDPSNERRVYAIGARREDLRSGDGIYVSDDGGLTFGAAVFTAPKGSALLTVSVAPSQPSTLFATMLSTPENHPILLRSRDSGAHWELAADLVDSLGLSPFELLAIDAADSDRLYARVLEPFAETLAISADGGLTFVRAVSIPGKLNAFLKLPSGTMLVAGSAGTEPLAYRSTDGGQSFEPWPEAPLVHALAERQGKLYVAADHFVDGFALAVSDDEGAHLTPISVFEQVRGLRTCVADVCAEPCAYYAGIGLWPAAVCGGPPDLPVSSDLPASNDSSDAGAAGPPAADRKDQGPSPRAASAQCAFDVVASRPGYLGVTLLTLSLMVSAARRIRRVSVDT
jgi:hypothetical protein